MINRYNRSNFLKTNIVDGKEEFDLNTNTLNDFKFTREKTYYTITEEDLIRPDLISSKAYKDIMAMHYWHIVLFVNEIHDVWNDLVVGDVLNIPHKKDIEDFVVFSRNRK